MAKSPINTNSQIAVRKNNKQEIKKYTCGCGKRYTSYPAYSTHRKSKHNNINVEGTLIPRLQNPKRGRPSYEFVRRQQQGNHEQMRNYYQALTVIELGLLRLNEKYGGVISQSHEESRYRLSEELVRLAGCNQGRKYSDAIGVQLQIGVGNIDETINDKKHHSPQQRLQFIAKLLILFIELMTTHMTATPAQALIGFITQLLIYTSSTQQQPLQSSQSSLPQPSTSSTESIFDISIFNNYFSRQENKEQINKFSNIYGLKQQFFVTVSVILSHWVYQLGYCDKVVKVKGVSGDATN